MYIPGANATINSTCGTNAVMIDLIVSSNDAKPADLQMHVYPNPAKAQIWVESPFKKEAQPTLIDITGSILMRKEINVSAFLEVTDIPSGTYLLQLQNEKQQLVEKVTIQC